MKKRKCLHGDYKGFAEISRSMVTKGKIPTVFKWWTRMEMRTFQTTTKREGRIFPVFRVIFVDYMKMDKRNVWFDLSLK